MLSFAHPLALLASLALPLIPWMLRRLARRSSWERVPYSSLKIVRKESWIRRVLAGLPRWLLYTAAFLAIVAWANPLGGIFVNKLVDRGYRFALAFDVSGSMSGNPLNVAKESVVRLVETRKKDVFAVIPFEETVRFSDGIPFTSDRKLVIDTVNKLQVTNSTALGDGLLGALWFVLSDIYAVNELKKKGESLIPYEEMAKILGTGTEGQRVELANEIVRTFGTIDGAFIVAVTDEGSNSGIDVNTVIRFSGRLGLPMYIIGVNIGDRSWFAEALRENGGEYFGARSAADIAHMYERINQLKPTNTSVVVQLEHKSGRPYVFVLIALCLFVASVLRGSYVVID